MEHDHKMTQEMEAFDQQAVERIRHGFIPDLRRLVKVDWFYNNVWRDPEFVKIHWMPRIDKIIQRATSIGNRVLELGCGFGMLSLECARHGLHVTGIDLSHKHIELANQYKDENPYNEKFGSLEYLCEDFNKAELGEDTYDTVIFFRSFHHAGDGDTLMAKVCKALKKGGQLLMSEPVRGHFTKEGAHFASILRAVLPTWMGYEEKLGKEWNPELWEKEVESVFQEYRLQDTHLQSPMDNTLDHSKDIIRLVEKYFIIKEQEGSDAFLDKLIGGLRGDHKYEMARFLKFLDAYMVRNEILPPTSLELWAVKE